MRDPELCDYGTPGTKPAMVDRLRMRLIALVLIDDLNKSNTQRLILDCDIDKKAIQSLQQINGIARAVFMDAIKHPYGFSVGAFISLMVRLLFKPGYTCDPPDAISMELLLRASLPCAMLHSTLNPSDMTICQMRLFEDGWMGDGGSRQFGNLH
jgi:hypothetical protein